MAGMRKRMPENSEIRNNQNPKRSRVRTRTWILWIAIIGSISLLILCRHNSTLPKVEELHTKEFFQKLTNNEIVEATIKLSPKSANLHRISGRYVVGTNGTNVEKRFTLATPLTEAKLDELLNRPN